MKLFMIAGMHRSGTSTVSRISNMLGLDLGPDDELMDPAEDNPEGFWENETLTSFNDRVLFEAGGTWHDPPVFEVFAKSRKARELRKQGQELLENILTRDPAGWKDPRSSVLGWLWEPAIDGVVVCVRDPDEVANSLNRRNDLPHEQSYKLWLRYTLDCLTMSAPKLILTLDQLNNETENTCRRLSSFMDLPDPDETAIGTVRDYVKRGSRSGTPRRANEVRWRTEASDLYARIVSGDPIDEKRALLAWVKEPTWIDAYRRSQESLVSIQQELEESASRQKSLSSELEKATADIASMGQSLGKLEIESTLAIERVRTIREAVGEERFWEMLGVHDTRAED